MLIIFGVFFLLEFGIRFFLIAKFSENLNALLILLCNYRLILIHLLSNGDNLKKKQCCVESCLVSQSK